MSREQASMRQALSLFMFIYSIYTFHSSISFIYFVYLFRYRWLGISGLESLGWDLGFGELGSWGWGNRLAVAGGNRLGDRQPQVFNKLNKKPLGTPS